MKLLITAILALQFFSIVAIDAESKTKKKTPKNQRKDQFQNQMIDYQEFQKIVDSSAEIREAHRVSEKKFLSMMKDPDVIVLDARSESRYNQRHILGAKNLPFTEFTESSLKNLIPTKQTKILIYCNNNFEGSPDSFAAKAPAASLNLSTYTSLKAYGYEEIYELGPLLDVNKTKIPFEGSELKKLETKEE